VNNFSRAQCAYDNQRPAEFYDDGIDAKREQGAKLTAAEQFLRVLQRGDPSATIPAIGAVRNLPIDSLMTYFSNDCARLLVAACAQALTPGASLGTAERFAEDRLVADRLRTFMAAMAEEYADDNVEAWL